MVGLKEEQMDGEEAQVTVDTSKYTETIYAAPPKPSVDSGLYVRLYTPSECRTHSGVRPFHFNIP